METFTASDNTTLHYVSLGHGRPLIFLHGWTANAREWLPFAAELADRFQVFCWDARGHGDHAYAAGCNTDVSRMALDLQELIELHRLEDVVLVGHSMGALTAWEYIRQQGTRHLTGLCLIDQSPKLVTDEGWQEGIYGHFCRDKSQNLLERLQQDFAEGVLELIAFGNNRRSRENYERNSRGFQQIRQYLQQLDAPLLTRCWRSLTAADYREVLPAIDVPALLVYGDESQFYSLDLARWVAQQIGDSELHIYEKSDHSPHLWHRERFVYDLGRFAQRIAAQD